MRKHRVTLGRWKNRPGRIVVSWRDLTGRRRTQEFEDSDVGRDEAGKLRLKILRDLDLERQGSPDKTIGQCARDWLTAIKHTVRPTSYDHYERNVKNHVFPLLGEKKRLAAIHTSTVREALLDLMRQPIKGRKNRQEYGRATARDILGTLRAMFAWAADDLTNGNPTYGVARKLKLDAPSEVVKVMSLDEIAAMLRELDPAFFLHATLFINTGVRLGEGFGIQERHFDYRQKTLYIQQQVYASGRVGPPKTAKGVRYLEISTRLAELIGQTFNERKAGGIVSPWLLEPRFELPNPHSQQASRARNRFYEAVKNACAKAMLSSNYSPHSLRHTFATEHLTRGRTIEWVASQMGDNPQVVWKTYAKWLKPRNSEAADDYAAQIERAVGESKVTKFRVRPMPLALGL